MPAAKHKAERRGRKRVREHGGDHARGENAGPAQDQARAQSHDDACTHESRRHERERDLRQVALLLLQVILDVILKH